MPLVVTTDVTTDISFYQVIKALRWFAENHPIERVPDYQLAQIQSYHDRLAERLKERQYNE